ncbi:MAG TPA: protein kinase [Gemmataceae bacterium]|nr:protein kinase [Gemmataceae bacterium]
MPAPTTINEFLDLVRKSGVLDDKKLDAYLDKLRAASAVPSEPAQLASLLVRDGLLTNFQAEQFLLGKWRRFTIGKYKVLERLGAGGMGSVYLCEHKLMRRRVAVKVLPTAKADDPSSLERFYREARCVAALDHPNIVRAYDIDQDDKLHFLVMEYVDGASLQEIVKRSGPMDVLRACHYIRQAAVGLQHAHETAGLVHRDIKPGNILVDRNGIVKVLDMGLARFFHDEEDILTKKYDENVLGTADYLAPEQALDSHGVDIRADIYSLGATFYFLLTGRTPFTEGTVAQKLIWHQTRQPKPIRSIRPEVPEGVVAIVEKMMAKDPNQRYQTPLEVVEALTPWTQTPIPPPPESEMPRLSLAAMGGVAEQTPPASGPAAPGPASPAPRKSWSPPPGGSGARPLTDPTTKRTGSPGPTGQPPREPRALAAVVPASPVTPRAQPVGSTQVTLEPTSDAKVVAAPAVEPVPAEESIPWDQLAPDTDDLSARADTAARPSDRPAVSRPWPNLLPIEGQDPRRLWWVAALAAILLLALGGLLWWLIAGSSTPSTEATASAASQRPVLKVSQSARDGYRTVAEALRKARAGDRIVIHDPTIREALSVDGRIWKVPRDVTVEPAEDLKEPVRWLLPEKARADQIVVLSNLEGFTLKGITFDGEQRVQDAVLLTGHCPGLTLEDVSAQGCKRSGLMICNCMGASGRPVSVVRLKAVTARDGEAAVAIQLNPDVRDPAINQYITFRDCRHEGPSKAPLKFNPTDIKDVDLAGWYGR